MQLYNVKKCCKPTGTTGIFSRSLRPVPHKTKRAQNADSSCFYLKPKYMFIVFNICMLQPVARLEWASWVGSKNGIKAMQKKVPGDKNDGTMAWDIW
jgi:hypothetical protein